MNKLGTFVISVSPSPSLSLAPSSPESSVLSRVFIVSLISLPPSTLSPILSQCFSCSLFTWVSSTNWANCQGSMKHKLETPRATMAVLLGFRVLGREERQRKGKKKKEIEWWESVGVETIREDALRRLRKHTHTHAHTFNFTASVLQRAGYVPSQPQKYDTEFILLLKPLGEEVTVYRLHSHNTRWRPLVDVQWKDFQSLWRVH